MLALISLLAVACKDKKEDKKEEPTTAPTTTPTTTEPTTTTTPPATDVPKFSDPEVQKFANDYAAFINEYKAGMNDPAKLADLTQKLQDWSKKSTDIGVKLASKPEEAAAWSNWLLKIAEEIMPK